MVKTNDTQPVRLVILENDRIMMRGMKAFFDDDPGFEVVGIAGDLEEFLRIAEEKKPDVALVDLRLGSSEQEKFSPSGITAIERVQRMKPLLHCIAYSAFEEHGEEALQAGASAFLPKGIDYGRLVQAIRGVLYNDEFRAPRDVWMRIRDRRSVFGERKEVLTKREREVFCEWVNCPEATREAIAQKLGIKTGTVRSHLGNIYRKLGVHSRGEAILKAQELGLLNRRHEGRDW
jgi:DNA-binding NarL/FixJ family response regulator